MNIYRITIVCFVILTSSVGCGVTDDKDDSIGELAMRHVSPSYAGVVLVGDANQDGIISHDDAAIIAHHLLTTNILTGDSLNAADITGDGTVSTMDASEIEKYLDNP